MFCSKCGVAIEEGAKFCAKCGNQIATEHQESSKAPLVESEKKAEPKKKKSKAKLWIWLGVGTIVLRVICAMVTSDDENGRERKSSVQSQVMGDERKVDSAQEIQNAKAAIKWVKTKDSMTELQRNATFKKFKGQWAIFKGEVREVGEKVFGGTFVSLKVDRLSEFENVNIEIVVPDALKETVCGWSVGETRVLRGCIEGTGDLEDDLTCRRGEIVEEADYQKYAAQADEGGVVEGACKLKSDANPIPHVAAAQSNIDFKSEIENAKVALNWIRSKEKMTELQQETSFKKLVGLMVVFKGEVREVGEKVFGGTFVSLKVDKLDAFENINVEFIVPNSMKDVVSEWGVGETHVMRGCIEGSGDLMDDLSCKRGEIVQESVYTKNL